MMFSRQLSLTSVAQIVFSVVNVNAFTIRGRFSSSIRGQQTRLFDVKKQDPSWSSEEEGIFNGAAFGLDEAFIAFPSRDYKAPEVVEVCMNALLHNGEPYANAGLEVCWNFSSDRCRASQGGSLELFIEFADNPVFSTMVDAVSWDVVSQGKAIPGTPTRGAMQTVLATVTPGEGCKSREFLWTLQRERRPPQQDCWLVHECIAKDAAYEQTL